MYVVTQRTQPTRLNQLVAEKLLEASVLLEGQDANPFRVAAYRKAAEVVAALESDIDDLLGQQGIDALLRLPHIGHGIAAAIVEIVNTGKATTPSSPRPAGRSPVNVSCAVSKCSVRLETWVE